MSGDGPLLVTGAGGQLGRAIGAAAPDAVLLGHEDVDVTDLDAVVAAIGKHRPTVIVHAAAWTAVDAAEADPAGAWAVNVEGTRNVAEGAGSVGALLLYPSTDYVFGGTLARPYTEDDEPDPLSVYGRTKLEGENVARSWERHLVIRTSWVFGEGRNFIATILERARLGEDLQVVADQVGLPTYAPDLAGGMLALVARGATGTVHLAGGGRSCSWADLADAALDAAAREGYLPGTRPVVHRISTPEHRASRSGPIAPRPANSVLDCSRAAAAGVRLRPWLEAVEEFVRRLRRVSRADVAGRERGR